MSLTKHYAPLMIPLALHEEPTQPEFHCYPASEVDGLSQDCAVLRQEIKDNEEELAKTQGALDEARKEIERLQSELTSLRRPVVQSAEIERIRARYVDDFRALAFDASVVKELNCWQDVANIRELLSALEQAQREIHDLRCPPDADGDQHACKVCGFAIRYGERHGKCGRFVMALEAEIARLSSPPQERAEIAGRQAERNTVLARWDFFCGVTAQQAIADIDTLLGDCAAWRNAHALVTAERDEARGKCKTLEDESVEKQSALTNWRDTAFRMSSKHAAAERCIERLEGALSQASVVLERIVRHVTIDDVMPEARVAFELAQQVLFSRSALAAADGQQTAPDAVDGRQR